MNSHLRAPSITEVYRCWPDRGIGEQEASRWVRVLRQHAMTEVIEILDGNPSTPWMDWALVSGCLREGAEHADAKAVRRWLDSEIPLERVEAYLPAGLSVKEAQEVERSGTYCLDSLLLLAALRSEDRT